MLAKGWLLWHGCTTMMIMIQRNSVCLTTQARTVRHHHDTTCIAPGGRRLRLLRCRTGVQQCWKLRIWLTPYFGSLSQFTIVNWTPWKIYRRLSVYKILCDMWPKKLSVSGQTSKHIDKIWHKVVWKIYLVFWGSNSNDKNWRELTRDP